MSFGNTLQQVAGVSAAFRKAMMNPAALLHTALQLTSGEDHGLSGVRSPFGEGFAYGDHKLDAIKAPLVEVGDELRPEGHDLAVARIETQQLVSSIGVNDRGTTAVREVTCWATPWRALKYGA